MEGAAKLTAANVDVSIALEQKRGELRRLAAT